MSLSLLNGSLLQNGSLHLQDLSKQIAPHRFFMKIIITSPSLDKNQNVSGIASITEFIINNNTDQTYVHFESGKRDMDKRNLRWLLRILKSYQKWFRLLVKEKNVLVHFNMPLSTAAIIRDAPLIIITR